MMKRWLLAFLRKILPYIKEVKDYLYKKLILNIRTDDAMFKKLKRTSEGLYSLLPLNRMFSYTVILVLDHPKVACFKRCLDSLETQTYPIEIVVGFLNSPTDEELSCLENFQRRNVGVHVLQVLNDSREERVSFINHLAKKAKGNFLLFIDEEGWVRPDWIFRYEQTLRLIQGPQNAFLYCNLVEVSETGLLEENPSLRQPNTIKFPFFFDQIWEYGFLISKSLWSCVGGLRSNVTGAEWEDLFLRASRMGAQILHIPFPLCAIRKGKPSKKEMDSFIRALESYCCSENLNWTITSGYLPTAVRAHPKIESDHLIQIIIPYKDQREMTLQCIRSLLGQTYRSFKITAVDNQSSDRSIAEEISRMGGEVIYLDEPFNYSRMNNIAVQRTITAKDADLLLFLNNDVELDPNAIEEMVSWIELSAIGIVGCRLHYPNQALQHGGVALTDRGDGKMHWNEIDKFRFFKNMHLSKKLSFVDAVTAACAMMKKKDFIAVDGFDEIWYPISYSDTNLAVKLAAIGLKPFYTPYAVGVHHESVSRGGSIEDYENSFWLHHLMLKNGHF